MAKVTFEAQPKLTKREAELLDILEEIGLEDLKKCRDYLDNMIAGYME